MVHFLYRVIMPIKNIFLFISLLFLNALHGYAQNNVLFDVFANEEYAYQKKYKEVKDYELNINGEIDIEYFALRNERGMNYDRLNKMIEAMALTEWKDKQKKFELNNEVKAKIAAYNELKFRNNDRHEQGIDDDFNPQLKSIDINVLSVCNNIVTFYQNFKYNLNTTMSRYNNRDIDADIIKYYTLDIYTQKMMPLKAIFNDANTIAVEQELLPFLNQFEKEIKAYLEANPEEENEEYESDEEEAYQRNKAVKNIKLSGKINIKDADIYWYGWGLMLNFPEYCKSSVITKGESFSVFIPFDKCKATLDLFPSYASLKQLIKPAHQFTNFDYFEMLNEYSKFRHEPSVTSLFKINNVLEKPKSLTSKSYQVFKDNNKNYRGDFVFEFDQKARNFQQEAAKAMHTYYLENINGKPVKRVNKSSSQKVNYIYDEKGNLIVRKSEESLSGNDYYYFYNLDNCYSFSVESGQFSGDERIAKTSFKNGELCLKDMCLTFDKNMQVIGVKMLKSLNNDIELGFDEKGRLVEGHTENDRYNYYFEFDAYDRLVKYITFEYQKISKELVYFYKDQERLPYLQQKHTYNNDIFEEETYDWEF